MKIVEVDPEEVPNFRESHRGRVSYPILKSFLETGFLVGKIDRTGIQQSFQSLYSSLTAYIRSHEMPIKLFSRGGELYLARLDLDADGNEVPDWNKPKTSPDELAVEITSEEVARRYEEEKGQATK